MASRDHLLGYPPVLLALYGPPEAKKSLYTPPRERISKPDEYLRQKYDRVVTGQLRALAPPPERENPPPKEETPDYDWQKDKSLATHIIHIGTDCLCMQRASVIYVWRPTPAIWVVSAFTGNRLDIAGEYFSPLFLKAPNESHPS